MAVCYLRSTDGNDADDGSTWALAKATLAAAMTVAGAGGTVYVSSSHSELPTGATTWTSPGTAASPLQILCVNDAAAPPTALATGAVIGTTNNVTDHINLAGHAYCYGVTWRCRVSGTGAANLTVCSSATTTAGWIFEACILEIATTSTTARIVFGTRGALRLDQFVKLINTTVKFASTSQAIIANCPVEWIRTSAAVDAGGSTPTTLFASASDARLNCRAVDFSLVTGTLVAIDGTTVPALLHFNNCQLGTGVTIASGDPAGVGACVLEVVNCDSTNTNYRYYKEAFAGYITQETTIKRTGGASDGTTGVSRKMVTNANAKLFYPLELDCNVQWNEATGSAKTATVHIVTDNVTLTDAECWLEVEYLGSASYPVSTIGTDRAADVFATPANQTTSSETWTTTGLGTPVKQQLAVTFTPQMKGPIKCRVMLAKASTTVYVCPKVVLS